MKKHIKIFWKISFISAIFASVILLCLPFVSLDGITIQKVAAYIVASLFWLSIVIEILFTCLCTYERRKFLGIKTATIFGKEKFGMISFFKNKEAAVVDVIFLVLLLEVILIIWTQINDEWLIVINLSALLLSFNLHCLLNGENYRYIKLNNNTKEKK